MAKISLCMIARNEAQTIGRALGSVLPCVGEAIIIDDESSDNTAQIALAKGPNVQVFRSGVTKRPAYPDIQKNVAIDKATGDIIIVLDCDEVIDPDLVTILPDLVQLLMGGKCDSVGFIRRTYFDGRFNNPFHYDYQVRMWRNGLGIRSGEKLHEGIVGYCDCLWSNLIIYHFKTAAMQEEDNRLYASLMEAPE